MVEPPRAESVERTRSLTKRRSSSNTQDARDHPPVPTAPQPELDSERDQNDQDTRQPKSPLLTSHRLSTTSLDNVNLDEDGTPLSQSKSKGTESSWEFCRDFLG